MRIRLLLVAAVLGITTPWAIAEEPPFPRENSLPGGLAPEAPSISGLWLMESDSQLDGKLESATSQRLLLQSANGRIVGRCQHAPAEEAAPASVFVGEVIAGAPPLVTLRHDDPAGVVAVCQGLLVADGRIAGSYVNNRGGQGDWALTQVAARYFKPAAAVPDEAWFESVLGVYGLAIRGARQPFVNLRPPDRNLWTDEIQRALEGALAYAEVDYLGTAHLVIVESGLYRLDLPGAGVEFYLDGQRVEAGALELEQGMYEVEIYTNHWGQPYLTYAQAAVYRQGTEHRIPFVNTAAQIAAFRSQEIAGRRVQAACAYDPPRIDLLQP